MIYQGNHNDISRKSYWVSRKSLLNLFLSSSSLIRNLFCKEERNKILYILSHILTCCPKFLAWNRIASKSSGSPSLVTKQFLLGHCSKGSDPNPKPQSAIPKKGVKNKMRLTRAMQFSCGRGALKGCREYLELKQEVISPANETRTKTGRNLFQLGHNQSIPCNQEISILNGIPNLVKT